MLLWLSHRDLQQTALQQYLEDGLLLASTVEQQVGFFGALPDTVVVEGILSRALQQRPQYTQLILHGPDGQMVARVFTETPSQPLHRLDEHLQRALESGTGSYHIEEILVSGATVRYLEIASPIMIGGRVGAALGSYRPLAQADLLVNELMREAMVAGPTGIGVLLVILFVGIHAIVLRRVRRLEEVSRQLAAGDYQRQVAISGRDELAALGETFNQMARSVDASMKKEKTLHAQLIALYEQSQHLATTDGLTGLCNHREFQRRLGDEIERSQRYQHPFALLLIDIDHFKRVNDQRGHLTGDALLRDLAETICRGIRTIDVAARYGGEEFAVILPETSLEGARVVAERLRAQAATPRIIGPAGQQLACSISIGVATYPVDANRKERLIDAADKALYYAKYAGRNRVKTHQEFLRADFTQPAPT